jgi:hypothetical protein
MSSLAWRLRSITALDMAEEAIRRIGFLGDQAKQALSERASELIVGTLAGERSIESHRESGEESDRESGEESDPRSIDSELLKSLCLFSSLQGWSSWSSGNPSSP